MRKILFAIALFVVTCPVYAQSWMDVGPRGFTPSEADNEFIALDPAGTPYVAFSDFANFQKGSVMKYNGSSWVNAGMPGFTADVADNPTLAFDHHGAAYIAYIDGSTDGKTTVMKYDGTDWNFVGFAGLSTGFAGFTTMAIGTNDTPYVFFTDQVSPCIPQATLLKFNGSSWVPVGNVAFSPKLLNGVSFSMHGNTPYVVFSDTNGMASAMTFDGSNWVFLGARGFSAGFVEGMATAVDNSGTLYVAYTDEANSNKATVMKYNGASWVTVGTAGFTPAEADNVVVAIDATGTPYVAFADISAPDFSTTVMKYNGIAWVTVGAPGFSASLPQSITMAINASGTPYVCYQDVTTARKATVMRYGTTTAVQQVTSAIADLHVFPNPCNGTFTLNITTAQKEDATVTITNVLGEIVRTFTANTNEPADVILKVSPGVYHVTATTAEGTQSCEIEMQ